MTIFANPLAQPLNLAPSPYAHVLTRAVPQNQWFHAPNFNPEPVGYLAGTVPQPPERALPSKVNIASVINSLPSLFDIFHG